VGTLFGIAAGLAVVIACIGLFGLAAFTVQHRRKEIGIRKVLGATATSIVRLFAAQYAALVAVAFIVAAPVSYFAMQAWLQDFAYRTDVGFGLLLSAGAVAMGVALATVCTQALRAARIDPATTLQSE
jgi:putative ABC transport system permease protein